MSKFSDSTFYLAPSGYRESVLYPQKPLSSIGHLSVGRASSATRTNPAGQVEEVCYNLLQYSEDFSNAVWTKTNTTVVTNAETAPNGTLTADKVTANAANGQIGNFIIQQTIVYTVSAYVKSATGSNVAGRIGGQSSSGTFTSFTATNEWTRVSCTALSLGSNRGSTIEITNNGDSLYIWGAQLVQGNLPKDYLYTSDRLNFPRVDYSDGSASFLLEPQRTNLVANSTMVGAIAGSPGTAPTTWAFNGVTGLTRTISLGTEDGLEYIDFRFQGVATQTFITILPNSTSYSSSAGQVYTFSGYIKLVSGSIPNLRLVQLDNASNTYITSINPTSTLTRYTQTTPALPSGNVNIRPYFDTNALTIGQTYDFTIRIAQPQMELGAYVTTPIFTLGSAAVTRLADTFTRNNIFTNNLISSSGGTWFVELKNNLSLLRDTFTLIPLIIGDGATSPNNGLLLRNSGGSSMRLEIRKLIAGSTTLLHTTTTDSTKLVIKWNGSSCDVFVNGIKQVSASSFATTNMDFLVGNGVDVPKYITQMALWNTPLSDSQCIEITGVAYTTPAQAYGSLNLVSESPDCLYTSVNTINRI
jgi:hypothetical protein